MVVKLTNERLEIFRLSVDTFEQVCVQVFFVVKFRDFLLEVSSDARVGEVILTSELFE